jgi:hypothetical protein
MRRTVAVPAVFLTKVLAILNDGDDGTTTTTPGSTLC